MNRLSFLITIVLFISAVSVRSGRAQNLTEKAEILFFSNVNAALQNCGCGTPPLGGLAQMLPLINKKRQENKRLLVVDGGDFFNSYSYPDINRAVLEIYRQLNPDMVALGDQELAEGLSFFNENRTFFNRYLVASNVVLPKIHLQKNIPAIHVRILSWLDASAFDIIKKPSEVKLSRSLFKTRYERFEKDQIKIVVFHGARSALPGFISAYPHIDIILLAHAQSNIKQLKKRPFIIGGGAEGEYLKDILILKDGNQMKIQVHDIAVPMSVPPDTAVLKVIEKWQIK